MEEIDGWESHHHDMIIRKQQRLLILDYNLCTVKESVSDKFPLQIHHNFHSLNALASREF